MKRQFAELAERAESIDSEDCPTVMKAFTARVPREALAREAREIRFNEVRVEGDGRAWGRRSRRYAEWRAAPRLSRNSATRSSAS